MSKELLSPAFNNPFNVSMAGAIRRSIFDSRPASFQYRRATEVYSSETSQAMSLPSGGRARATAMEL
jgi:hypothetical protein